LPRQPGENTASALSDGRSKDCASAWINLAERLGPALGDLTEQRGHVHPDRLPLSSDPLGNLEKGLPGAAPDIENNVSRTEAQGFDGPHAQGRKPKINQLIRLGPRLRVEETRSREVR
jgi:hypothetical protein